MLVDIKVDLSDQVLSRMLANAIDGGASDYWIENVHFVTDLFDPDFINIPKVRCSLPIQSKSDYILVTLREEINGESVFRLDHNSVKNGIERVVDKYTRLYNNIKRSDIDLVDSDYFLQLCLFGDIMFS